MTTTLTHPRDLSTVLSDATRTLAFIDQATHEEVAALDPRDAVRRAAELTLLGVVAQARAVLITIAPHHDTPHHDELITLITRTVALVNELDALITRAINTRATTNAEARHRTEAISAVLSRDAVAIQQILASHATRLRLIPQATTAA